jgi:hypothetical protein
VVLRVGESNSALDGFLARLGVSEWAFVTAANPGSQLLPTEENALRHRRLREALEVQGYWFFPAVAIGDRGNWPPEQGFLIVGMAERDAVAMGRELGQNAIVYGCRGGLPRLGWCLSPEG